MQIPDGFLGVGPVVARRMRKLVQGLTQVNSAVDDSAFGRLVDVSEHPNASILCDQVDRNQSGDHFHSYAFFDAAVNRFAVEGVSHWFPWSLEKPWRFLGVLGGISEKYFEGEGRALRLRYLRAALDFGPSLEALGPRFVFLGQKKHFSECCGGVIRTLKLHGVSVGRDIFGVVERHLSEQS